MYSLNVLSINNQTHIVESISGFVLVVFTCFNDNESLHFLLYHLKEINGVYVSPSPLTYSILYEISG